MVYWVKNLRLYLDYKYSKALIAHGKSWSYQEMNSSWSNLSTYKGNQNGFRWFKSEKDRASVILYMNSMSDSPFLNLNYFIHHSIILFCA